MKIFIQELKLGRKALIIWTCSITAMLLLCVWMFPQMKDEMESVGDIFAGMGSFTAAFGMDRLNFGTLIGFYGIECGNIIGIGGGMFAALLGVAMLSKEEKDRTAEFLLTHPVSRARVLTEKLAAVYTQIFMMNIVIIAAVALGFISIGEEIPVAEFLLLHLAFLVMQLEIASLSFCFSSFIRRGSIGIGLGFALMLYFMNIIKNISDKAEFLKYITPYSYSAPADIIINVSLDGVLFTLGVAYSAVAIAVSYWQYQRKDIAA